MTRKPLSLLGFQTHATIPDFSWVLGSTQILQLIRQALNPWSYGPNLKMFFLEVLVLSYIKELLGFHFTYLLTLCLN